MTKTRKKQPLQLRLERPLVIFDIESTGTSLKVDRIIDIAMLKIHPNGNTESLCFRVNPGIPIPAEATAVHGITDADVKDAPPFSDVAGKIADFLEGCDLGGYNVCRFDVPLLEAELARSGLPVDLSSRNIVDAQRIYHTKVPRDLPAALHYYCGEMHLNAHSAMGDVEATWRVLQAQLERYSDIPRDVAGLSAYCNPRDPSCIDRTGKFRKVNGEVVFAFGKYERQPLKQVAQDDPDYLYFLLKKQAVPPDAADLIRSALAGQLP
jgi:DNA polymerase-3 subunit epsilon